MIGIIEIDEKDVSDDGHIILELPIEPERNGIQTVMRVKTNIKLQPERTGKWIKEKNRGQLYQCSACGNYLDFRGVNAGRGSANYCPNCGARMEESNEAD